MAADVDRIERAVGLAFEGLDVAVKVNWEVVPSPFLPAPAGLLNEKRFYLQLGCRRAQDDSSLGLNR